MIGDSEIIIDYNNTVDRDILDLLKEWVYSALIFQDFNMVFGKIKALRVVNLPEERQMMISPKQIKAALLGSLIYNSVERERWNLVDETIIEFNMNEPSEYHTLFHVLRYAAKESIGNGEQQRASHYLKRILALYPIESCNDRRRIYIADLIYKIEKDSLSALHWLSNINQPLISNSEQLGHHSDFDVFFPLITFNKLLNLLGSGVTITKAVPDVSAGADESILVEYQRMICLSTQILSDGIAGKPVGNISHRIRPIMSFFNKNLDHRNTYWHRIKQTKKDYFDFLIHSVSVSGKEEVAKLIPIFWEDFNTNNHFWTHEEKRGVLSSFSNVGIASDVLKPMLLELESNMLADKDIDGRITECTDHAKAMLLIDDKEAAEHWIKQSIRESIGVGYRKDYQFNTWIEWLKISFRHEPDKAEENILWFISHLRHLKETTEGRAFWSASAKILRTTLDWNFQAGINQLKWQLDSGLIDFEDAISSFVLSYLLKVENEEEYASILPVYLDIYLPVSDELDQSVLKSILEKGYQIAKENLLIKYLPMLYKGIYRNALEEFRVSLIETLKEFIGSKSQNIADLIEGFAVPEDNSPNEGQKSSNRLMTIPGNETLGEDEAMNLINNYDEFKELLSKEDSLNSWFDWTNVVTKIISNFTIEQIKDTAAIAKNGRKPIKILIQLSDHALVLGDKALAEELVNQCVSHSSETGWMTYYDGGTRLQAFQALQKVKGEVGVQRAFEVFSNDVMGSESSGTYAENLDEILPVISPGYDESKVWPEIFDYLKRLMSTSVPIEDLQDINPGRKNISECLIDLMYYLGNYDVSIIGIPAQNIMARQLAQNNKYAENLVLALNVDTDEKAEFFTGLLILARSFGAQLEVYEEKIIVLASSKNFLVRSEAQGLLEKIGLKLPEIPKITLPEFYNLQLTLSPSLQIPGVNKTFREVEEMVRPFGAHLKMIARATGIDGKNILYRVYGFMNALGIQEAWKDNVEGAYRAHLEEIRLKFSYAKPRVICAKRAIQYLMAELFDAGSIDLAKANFISRGRDKQIESINIGLKPVFIPALAQKRQMLSSNKWTNDLKNNIRLKELLLKTDDGLYVIAEYTFQCSLNWEKPSQTYMSQISGSPVENESFFIFGSVFNELSSDYHNMKCFETSIIIVRNHHFGQSGLQSTFIAINPTLARFLGWIPNPAKLFAWMAADGTPLIESVFWSDGTVTMPPPHLYSEAGEGWYVLASDNALEQIKSAEPELYLEKLLIRSAKNDSIEESASHIIPIK